jgi:hypothetical protein
MPSALLPSARLNELSRRPFRGRMLRDIEMHQPAPAVAQHDQHKQDSKGRRRHREEVQRDQILGVVPQKRAPRLRRRPTRPDHVQDHPLRPLRAVVDAVLKDLSPRFSRLYATTGRPSVAPERLLRALLLQVLYSIRSERQLMEQLDYILLYRWFVGLNMDDPRSSCRSWATGIPGCRSATLHEETVRDALTELS